MSSVKISIRLDPELAARIAKMARELGTTDSEATRALIVRGLDANRDGDAINEMRERVAKTDENIDAIANAVTALYKRLVPDVANQ